MGSVRSVKQNQGYAIVLLIVILMVATGLGLMGLRSSQGTLKKMSVRKTETSLKYDSERALQKALQRIQMIAQDEPDVIAIKNHATPKNFEWLIGPGSPYVPQPSSGISNKDAACINWSPGTDFDRITSNSNVVCNFMGIQEMDVQVMLVRKDDFVSASGENFGIFLLSAIAYDESRRRNISQGVVVVPYSGSSVEEPYLSSIKKVTED